MQRRTFCGYFFWADICKLARDCGCVYAQIGVLGSGFEASDPWLCAQDAAGLCAVFRASLNRALWADYRLGLCSWNSGGFQVMQGVNPQENCSTVLTMHCTDRSCVVCLISDRGWALDVAWWRPGLQARSMEPMDIAADESSGWSGFWRGSIFRHVFDVLTCSG